MNMIPYQQHPFSLLFSSHELSSMMVSVIYATQAMSNFTSIEDVSCTTFNILAPIYRRLSCESRESEFRDTWLSRNEGILDRLLHLRSSIICLREFWVGNEELVSMYRRRLNDAGYVIYELARTNNRGDDSISNPRVLLTHIPLYRSDRTLCGVHRSSSIINQGGEEKYLKAWTHICEISRREFAQVYQRLNVHLEEKGESFYNSYIPGVMKELEGLIQESEGARVIAIEGKNIPLIVVKSDGGYNYASTDLTALWYRLNHEKADWIIYVTDVGQHLHFDMVFSAAKLAGWLSDEEKYPKTSHVGFGLVLGDDGKRFRTRSTTVVRLADLLDEAKFRSKAAFEERGKTADWTEEEVEEAAHAVGYGAVKYADLKNNRETNYTFNFERMLSDKGNTALYLLYAHARICSIIRKSGRDIEELKQAGTIVLDHPDERALGLHLLRFAEIEEAITNLYPHVLCEYLYGVSEHFTTFYTNCQVVGSAEEESRLLLCEATAIVMRKCFHLLGITPVYKI